MTRYVGLLIGLIGGGVISGCGDLKQTLLSVEGSFSTNSIVGGEASEVGRWPFIVGRSEDSEVFCGGTLSAPHWVLTAAHCVGRLNPEDVTALIGAYDLYDLDHLNYDDLDPTEERGSVEFIIHPDYNRRSDLRDNALVQ